MFYVYVHTVPNGKQYIGCTKDINHRWNNGEGYVDNKEFYRDISIYGWNHIKHEIIAEYQGREEALQLESALISLLKTENKNFGYNRTTIYDDAMKKYNERSEVNGVFIEKEPCEETFFESLGLPISACEEMINQWIFNDKHRQMMKSRLIDGLSYAELSKKFGKSERQIKNIIYDGCRKLEKRF